MKRVWKNRSILNLGIQFESRMEKRLWKVQSRFYPGDLMIRTGDREIRSVSGRLPDNPGELACMYITSSLIHSSQEHWNPQMTSSQN